MQGWRHSRVVAISSIRPHNSLYDNMIACWTHGNLTPLIRGIMVLHEYNTRATSIQSRRIIRALAIGHPPC